ncbi:MAG: zinc ribbon domain-containing protein [Clostridia bacterium]|nr:zinc ribbon domain-containing protein [Clostridia bacterium]
MKCRNCGAELDEGALFCRKCGTAAPTPGEGKAKKRALKLPDFQKLLKNRRLLTIIGGCAAVLLLLILILCLATCGKAKTGFSTADEAFDAALDALKAGDGERLSDLTKTSEAFLGAHPETFGEGDSPEAVMKGYYKRLANDFAAVRKTYGTDAAVEAQLETETLTGSAIFEANRALNVDAEEYATAKGSLTINGETVKDVYLAAAKLDGEWKLIVVYFY